RAIIPGEARVGGQDAERGSHVPFIAVIVVGEAAKARQPRIGAAAVQCHHIHEWRVSDPIWSVGQHTYIGTMTLPKYLGRTCGQLTQGHAREENGARGGRPPRLHFGGSATRTPFPGSLSGLWSSRHNLPVALSRR